MVTRRWNLIQRVKCHHRIGLHGDVAVHIGGGGCFELDAEARQPRPGCWLP
jgi:hypothetical protein